MIATLIMAGKILTIRFLRFIRLTTFAEKLNQRWAGK
jgi:hypothetical protein